MDVHVLSYLKKDRHPLPSTSMDTQLTALSLTVSESYPIDSIFSLESLYAHKIKSELSNHMYYKYTLMYIYICIACS